MPVLNRSEFTACGKKDTSGCEKQAEITSCYLMVEDEEEEISVIHSQTLHPAPHPAMMTNTSTLSGGKFHILRDGAFTCICFCNHTEMIPCSRLNTVEEQHILIVRIIQMTSYDLSK